VSRSQAPLCLYALRTISDRAEGTFAHPEAKFWIEPEIELARLHKIKDDSIRRIKERIEEHEDEIKDTWYRYFIVGPIQIGGMT